MISRPRRFSLFFVAVAGFVASMSCSQGGVGSSSGASSSMDVQITQFAVTVTNKAGRPLMDIRVAIMPYGGATMFTASYGRIENSEKREFSFNDFRGKDGTPFDRRVVRSKSVVVTAKDIDNKDYQLEVPWK